MKCEVWRHNLVILEHELLITGSTLSSTRVQIINSRERLIICVHKWLVMLSSIPAGLCRAASLHGAISVFDTGSRLFVDSCCSVTFHIYISSDVAKGSFLLFLSLGRCILLALLFLSPQKQLPLYSHTVCRYNRQIQKYWASKLRSVKRFIRGIIKSLVPISKWPFHRCCPKACRPFLVCPQCPVFSIVSLSFEHHHHMC